MAFCPVHLIAFSFNLAHQHEKVGIVLGMDVVGQLMEQHFSDAEHLSKAFQIVCSDSKQDSLPLVFVQPHDANGGLSYLPVWVQLSQAPHIPPVLRHARQNTRIVRQPRQNVSRLLLIGQIR
jgi:hypothetical protein